MAMMEALLKIRADVQGEGKVDALGKALGGLNNTAQKVGNGLSGIAGKLGGLGGALGSLAGLASGAGLAALAKNAIDTADNLRDMSIRTGVSVEQLSKLKTAAEMSGATIDDVGKVLTKTAVAIANAPGNALNATANAVAAGTSVLQGSVAQQVALIEQRERQQVAAIRSGAEQQIATVKDREQRQIDAVDRAAEQRINSLQRETDARMREINRRYRQEEKLLNDSYDDQRSRAQRAADDELRVLERRIERTYEARRKAIQADKGLSDAQRDNLLQQLQDAQEQELRVIRQGFEDKAKIRDRALRDQQERDQQAIEDRKRREEEAEKARTEALKRQVHERAKAEKDAIQKASAARIADIKAAMTASIKEIESGTKRAQGAYAKLGVALRNQDGSARKTGDVLMDVFDALQKLPNAAARTAALVDLYGKAGPRLAAMFAMGRGEVEKLAATFTTDFANAADSFNDKQVLIGASFSRLGASIATVFLPAVESIAGAVGGLVDGFNMLPGPIQSIVGIVGALTAGFLLLAPAISSLISIAGVLGGLQIGATIAGWAGAIGPAVAGITAAFTGLLAWLSGTLVPALIGIFSGPVGWTVLAVAAVVAMAIAFRKPILDFFAWLGGAVSGGLQALWQWGEPIRTFWAGIWNGVIDNATRSLQAIGTFIDFSVKTWYAIVWQVFVQPWINLWNNVIREPVSGALTWVSATFQAGLTALGNAAYGVFIQPWINLWQNVFRQPVVAAVNWMSTAWGNVSRAFNAAVVQPIARAWNGLVQLLPQAMNRAVSFVQNTWTGMIRTIQNALRGFLFSIARGINAVVGAVNKVISGFNSLPGPDIPFVPGIIVPGFAKGGFVTKPTLAMVGEGSEDEYIIPENKMGQASRAYLAGARGTRVFNQSQSQFKSAFSNQQAIFASKLGIAGNSFNAGQNRLIRRFNNQNRIISNAFQAQRDTFSTQDTIARRFTEGQAKIANAFTSQQRQIADVVTRQRSDFESRLGRIGQTFYSARRNMNQAFTEQQKQFGKAMRQIVDRSGLDEKTVSINVTTGPVMEFNGERYVKLEELDRAMRATADGVIGRLRTPSARISLGLR